jgi:hypothetical protein
MAGMLQHVPVVVIKRIFRLSRTKSTFKLDILSAVRRRVIVDLHESYYEAPSQKNAAVVGDCRVCFFYTPVLWNFALALCETLSIAATTLRSRFCLSLS